MDKKMLKNIVTLVTGGASGIGKATVERVVKQGGKAVICDLPNTEGDALAAELGPNSIFCPADVTSETSIQDVFKITKEKFGRLDVLVSCAGIVKALKTYNFPKGLPHKLDDFSEVLAVNTIGTFNAIRLAVELIGQNKPNEDGYRGLVLNVSSGSAFEGQVGQVAYAASKAAVVGMTLPLARELASQGIRVCTICPGLFDTPLLVSLSDKLRNHLYRSIPHPQRFGKPEEFAIMVQSIIKNPILNGAVIRLDGAYRMNHFIPH